MARNTLTHLNNLRLTARETQSVDLSGTRTRVRLSVLAPDLFRFRATSGRTFAASPSIAIAPSEWPPCDAAIRSTSQRISLRTSHGELRLSPRSGEFHLLASTGQSLLHSINAQTGFRQAKPLLGFQLNGRELFFGMGEASGPFNRAGLVQEFWNIDVLGHGGIHPGQRNLYTAVPFTVMTSGDRVVGLFWDNSARQRWDLGQSDRRQWRLEAASGEIDLYLFTGNTVADVVRRFADLTGRMPMPPRWALGYHQCRYSYASRAELEKVARQLRRRRIPCDALYLDIHHMDGFRVFTFGKTFPQPREMMARLRRKGFRPVAIVDPGVKLDRRFGVYRRGKQLRAYVRTPDGKRDYVGKVWPGRSVFPDFFNPRVRDWWGREQARLQRLGVAGFWNDMNEPANFESPDKTLPGRCVHNADNGLVRHSEAHNLYGMQMARASRDGALKHQPDERPFIITRAAYAGTQRHAMLWTGDNASTWEHLSDSVQMLLNLGLSGFPFCGSDAGGFLENCTPELYARWMQLAAFTPFFRNHTMEGTLPHEPWCFGKDVETIVRTHIELRYQLLPYWYCLFAEAHRTGIPIMRPLLWHFQNDPVAMGCGDQFLLGPSLLVAPVLQQGARARSVYLPAGVWFDFWTGKRHRGKTHITAQAPLHRLPLFVRGGTILPMAALRQHTGGTPDTTIHLHLWPDGRGELAWHEDDGLSMNYERGTLHRRIIRRDGKRLQWEPAEGNFESQVQKWRLIQHAVARPPRRKGRRSQPRYDKERRGATIDIKNTSGAMTVALG